MPPIAYKPLEKPTPPQAYNQTPNYYPTWSEYSVYGEQLIKTFSSEAIAKGQVFAATVTPFTYVTLYTVPVGKILYIQTSTLQVHNETGGFVQLFLQILRTDAVNAYAISGSYGYGLDYQSTVPMTYVTAMPVYEGEIVRILVNKSAAAPNAVYGSAYFTGFLVDKPQLK